MNEELLGAGTSATVTTSHSRNRFKVGVCDLVVLVALLAAFFGVLCWIAPLVLAHVTAVAHRAPRLRLLAMFYLFVSCSLYQARRSAARFLVELPEAARQAIVSLRLGVHRWLKEEEAIHLLVLSLVIAIAIGVRLKYLFLPIRYDEAFTYLIYARQPLWDAISNYSFPNNHLVHTALVHICVRLFGDSEWSLRLPALLAGVAVVPATYLLARALLFDKNAALMSAATSAASVVLIDFSVSARGYSIVVLVSLLIFVLCTKIQKRGGSVVAWVALVIASGLGFAAIPTMLFPYGAAMAWTACSAALSRVRPLAAVIKEIVIATICTGVLAFIAYSPAVLRTGPHSILANRFVRPLDWAAFLKYAAGLPASLWRDWTIGVPGWLLAFLVFCLALSLLRYKQAFKSPLLLPIIVVIAIALCIVQRVVPPTRVFLYVVPILSIYSSAGVCMVLRFITQSLPMVRRTGIAVASLVCAVALTLSVVQSAAILRLDDLAGLRHAEEIVGFLRNLGPGRGIIAEPPCDAPLEYYARRHGVQTFSWVSGTTGPYLIVANELSATLAHEIQGDASFLTLGGIRKICGLESAESGGRLVKRYENNSVYIVDSQRSSCGAIVMY